MGGEAGVWGPHELGYTVNSMAMRQASGGKDAGRLLVACASFVPESPNFVEILTLDLEAAQQPVRSSARLPHYFPPSRVRWLETPGADLLATSGDCVRLWSPSGELQRLLRHESNPQGLCAPITSLDTAAPAAAGTAQLASCDVYGICALWDLERGVMQQAIDLGQPLYDVALGPGGLVAVAGERGDCFVVDPRCPQDVNVLALRERLRGPARIAWGSQRPDLFAVSWQGSEEGGVAMYSPAACQRKEPAAKLLRAGASHTADLQWSPAFGEFLCCAQEDGSVEVWDFPEEGLKAAGTATQPCFRWEPGGGGSTCTALAVSPEVRPGQHVLVVAAAPLVQQPGQQGAAEAGAAQGSSLWVAGLPAPTRR